MLLDVWLVRNQQLNIIKRHAQRDWISTTDIDVHLTLNSEHDWEDLCIRLRNQQP